MQQERIEELTEALSQKQYHRFTDAVDTMNAIDVAEYLSTLQGDRLLTAFRLLKKDIAADVFAELESEAIEQIVLATKDADLALLVDDLFIDDAVDLLEELPASMVKRRIVMRSFSFNARFESRSAASSSFMNTRYKPSSNAWMAMLWASATSTVCRSSLCGAKTILPLISLRA